MLINLNDHSSLTFVPNTGADEILLADLLKTFCVGGVVTLSRGRKISRHKLPDDVCASSDECAEQVRELISVVN